MNCRHCASELKNLLIDLGSQPPSNSYIKAEDLDKAELYLPLKVFVCSKCFLVQTADFTCRETFFNKDYSYFSSTSISWLSHAKKYVDEMIGMFGLDKNSFVMEVASNDGYLLKNFIERKIPCLGIEPTESTAAKSISVGIETLVDFYGTETARFVSNKYGAADLITCNNVYAHVPDINDFTEALEFSLSDNGVVTIELPHLSNLIKFCQFDTIYHEHYSYLSVSTVQKIFTYKGLRIFKVDELPTHGGSVRIYGCKVSANHTTCLSVKEILDQEERLGLRNVDSFTNFQDRATALKMDFLKFLLKAREEGKIVCGYGAAAKGNTFINFAGVKSDLLQFVADAAPSKIGKFLPGSRIPIVEPDAVIKLQPDYVVVLPWNIVKEVKNQFSGLRNTGAKFVTFVPNYNEI